MHINVQLEIFFSHFYHENLRHIPIDIEFIWHIYFNVSDITCKIFVEIFVKYAFKCFPVNLEYQRVYIVQLYK